MAGSLAGKTAFITGAAKRIGRTTALTLAREGVNLVIHYHHSSTEADTLCDEIQAYGVRSWIVAADLAQPDETTSLIARVLELAGALDILINNASIFPAQQLATMTLDNVYENININTWTPFTLCRQFAQLGRQGHIINMLDSRMTGFDWNHVPYLLSKQVLASLTSMMALAYAPLISVNGIAPGLILPPPGKDEAFLEQMRHTVPLQRHGDPQEIADTIVFLLKSSFITGEVIFVDGGRHLREYIDGPDINK